MPPAQAQIKGFSKRSSRKILTASFFNDTLEDSDKATKEFAKNFGKFKGDISIHSFTNFKHSIRSSFIYTLKLLCLTKIFLNKKMTLNIFLISHILL